MCRLKVRLFQYVSLYVDFRKKFIFDDYCINWIIKLKVNVALYLEIFILENKNLCLFNLNIYVCVRIYVFMYVKFFLL